MRSTSFSAAAACARRRNRPCRKARAGRDRCRRASCAPSRRRDERIGAGDFARHHRVERDVGMRREERARRALAFQRIERAVGKDDPSARLDQPDRPVEQPRAADRPACRCPPAISSRARRDGGGPCRSRSRARRAARHRTARPAASAASASTISASQPQPLEVRGEPLQAVADDVDRRHRAPAARAARSCRRAQRKDRRRAGPRHRRAGAPAAPAAASCTHHSPSA